MVKKGKYRMLLFDGHGSHLTRQVVSFYTENNIILLCLPSHSTHILQPCDVGAFLPLANAYRKKLNEKTRWGAGYSIDKMMFLEILREARIASLNKHNIKRSWEKTGLFPFNPEVVIGSLPAVILQREEEAAKAKAIAMAPPSRPTTSGQPAPLSIETPTDVNSINIVINISFKSLFDEFKSTLGQVKPSQDQQLKSLEFLVQKLGNSATAAITEVILTKGVNKELVESANYQKNRKKALTKGIDKISDARVLSLQMMDEAIRIKAEKKKAAEDKIAKEKRLKAQYEAWTTLYNQTLVQLRKWGPDMLQEVEDDMDLRHRLLTGTALLKALKTPRARKKALPATPSIKYILPYIEFDDLPSPLAKERSITVLPPLLSSPPSPSKRRSPKKTIRQRKKAKEAVEEVIEPLETHTISGRRSKRRLFHDEVLAKALANQRA
jgi:hypothetical protein